MAYDPYSTNEQPVAAKGMPDPDSIKVRMQEDGAGFREETDEPTYKARYGPGGLSMSRPVPVVPDTEEQLEDWLRNLHQQNEQLQMEHSEVEDQLSAVRYHKATLEARITTTHNTIQVVDKILQDHRRQMAEAGDQLENRRKAR